MLLLSAAGKGFGRGAAGRANTLLPTGATLASLAAGAALFSAVSSPSLFCCAASGNARNTLSTRITHRFCIVFLQVSDYVSSPPLRLHAPPSLARHQTDYVARVAGFLASLFPQKDSLSSMWAFSLTEFPGPKSNRNVAKPIPLLPLSASVSYSTVLSSLMKKPRFHTFPALSPHSKAPFTAQPPLCSSPV